MAEIRGINHNIFVANPPGDDPDAVSTENAPNGGELQTPAQNSPLISGLSGQQVQAQGQPPQADQAPHQSIARHIIDALGGSGQKPGDWAKGMLAGALTGLAGASNAPVHSGAGFLGGVGAGGGAEMAAQRQAQARQDQQNQQDTENQRQQANQDREEKNASAQRAMWSVQTKNSIERAQREGGEYASKQAADAQALKQAAASAGIPIDQLENITNSADLTANHAQQIGKGDAVAIPNGEAHSADEDKAGALIVPKQYMDNKIEKPLTGYTVGYKLDDKGNIVEDKRDLPAGTTFSTVVAAHHSAQEQLQQLTDAKNKKETQARVEQEAADKHQKQQNENKELPNKIAKEQAEANKANAGADKLKADASSTATSEWKPKVSADEKKKAELAENIAYNANEVNNMITRRADLLGKVAGRFTNSQQMIGNNDPDISALGTEIHNLAMANSGVHGFRSQEGVQETEHLLLNQFRNGPKAIGGAMNALTGSTQTFIDNARPEGYQTHSKSGGAVNHYANQGKGPKAATPKAGVVDGGFRFKGGNPADPNSWEKAPAGGASGSGPSDSEGDE